MDILHLVDRLENIVHESNTIPFSRKLLLDEDRLIDIIDQMRVTIPDVVRNAQKVTAERDRQLAQAQEESDRIRTLAKAESRAILENDQITKGAHIRAEQILEEAERQAAKTRADADNYVLDKFGRMEHQLLSVIQQVRNGIQMLREPDGQVDAREAEESA
jgi:flagellar biosynthesis/type III secretory pathway protein FliH